MLVVNEPVKLPGMILVPRKLLVLAGRSVVGSRTTEFSINVFIEFSGKKYYILKRPATFCVRDQDAITGSREDLEPNSCFSDLSDSQNSLNFWSI